MPTKPQSDLWVIELQVGAKVVVGAPRDTSVVSILCRAVQPLSGRRELANRCGGRADGGKKGGRRVRFAAYPYVTCALVVRHECGAVRAQMFDGERVGRVADWCVGVPTSR